ncbi:MAG: hypothetical protein K0R39_890 [Symbiobacteriaceae bacterium]|nr:hypothetical protein [Symbiobacteriaceae bacterium]
MMRTFLALLLACLMTGCATPAAPDAIDDLLAQHGWKAAGARQEGTAQLPAYFHLDVPGFPWRIVVDLSQDIGLDLASMAGREVRMVSLPVADVRGGRLEDLKAHVDFLAYILLDPSTGRPVGAYLIQTGKNGELLDGGPGPSLSGRDLHEITGLTWPEYFQKHRAKEPPADILAAEKPRNAIYAYFRAAGAHDCAALKPLLTDEVNSDAECERYDALASVRVIEIHGFIKADNPQGFRFTNSNEIAGQYYVILLIAHKPGASSTWQEGRNNLLIPLVQGGDGAWRLGPLEQAPSY